MFLGLVGLLVFPFIAHGQWTEEKIQALTARFQEYNSTWTRQDTTKLLRSSQDVNTKYEQFKDNSGHTRKITVMGGMTVLVDGKDITGNLGSKTTHGNNSPIIEDVQDSQITTGDESPINKNVTSSISFKISVSLSIALTLSLLVNFYQAWDRRRLKVANKAPQLIPERPPFPEIGE
ncbi:MAG: hypothetical protein CEE38_20375 [Planctomycetes bacterium B3_Pla]|nr:MAG: hypothetical protein CEE38_20375 [Planctomycetes bacterium B3_Pla]